MRHDSELATYLFEHARDVLLLIDAETGRIVDANRAAQDTYGYTHEDLTSRTIFDLRIEPPTAVSEQMRVANAAGILFEAIHRRANGTEFPVEVSSRGITLRGQRRLFSIVRDITERKRLETERDELLTTTQHALAFRDEFISIASHELRTPVTNVSLQLQQFMRLLDRGASRDELRVMADDALRETWRLSSLIASLLDAQVAKGGLHLERTTVDLGELLRDVTQRLRVRAEEVGTRMTVDVPSIVGHWDRLRIDQVVTNLLVNALKYGRGKPIDIVGRVGAAHATLEIVDRGIGVPASELERIFDKFERAVPSQYGGLGLGLFIARQIVHAHGGSLAVESTPGVGSTFRVSLPLT
ncbi:MAG: PAS domain-containing sensor histidine kinase [Myxococcota bacterium]|nr:PAS domain-containing sensor histidine kinase [Deltaproteobacteria bacterium]MDQ3334709.1 PAS domain-containing sensor histidine kinase [Myxococcota bacterium]